MNSFKNILKTMREMWSSNGTNLVSITVQTVAIYIIFLYINNKELISLLIGQKTIADFKEINQYIETLQNLEIDRTNLLIPVIVSVCINIPSLIQLKSSILNRLLPISTKTRLISILTTVITTTTLSLALVILLDYLLVLITKNNLSANLVTAQESLGQLYMQISSEKILSTEYKSFYNISSLIILNYSFVLLFNLLAFNIGLFFQRYSWIKGGAILILTLIISLYFYENNRSITPKSEVYLIADGFQMPTTFFIILIITLSTSLYHLLKEREE